MQGSVVVFGSWGSWTYDYQEFLTDKEVLNYCAYTPMMFAFIILLIKWVREAFKKKNYETLDMWQKGGRGQQRRQTFYLLY